MNHQANPLRFLAVLTVLWPTSKTTSYAADAPALSKNQELIVAAFELDVSKVKALLADGADINARMGQHPPDLFVDKWSSGRPIASPNWTPLLALAQSHREPQPEKSPANTVGGLNAAAEARRKVDPKLIAERDLRRLAIAKLLLGAKAKTDLHDGYGATALASAIYEGYDELALLLIDAGAAVNTKTGVYIDGSGDITPLHRATGRPQLVKALLEHGAKANAADSSGQTALHWAVLDGQPESVRLLIAAGADVNAKDEEGRTPLSWVRIPDPALPLPGADSKFAELYQRLFPNSDKMKEVDQLLRKAGAPLTSRSRDFSRYGSGVQRIFYGDTPKHAPPRGPIRHRCAVSCRAFVRANSCAATNRHWTPEPCLQNPHCATNDCRYKRGAVMSADADQRIAFDDFLAYGDDSFKADLIDGRIMPAGPETLTHNQAMGFVANLFSGYREAIDDRGAIFMCRYAFRLDNWNGVEPDVAFVRGTRILLALDTHMEGGPDIAVEIVARESRKRDYGEKLELYQEAGVEEYWIVDPLQQRVQFLRLSAGRYELAPLEDNRIYRSGVIPGFWLDVNWLLARPAPRAYRCLQQILAAKPKARAKSKRKR